LGLVLAQAPAQAQTQQVACFRQIAHLTGDNATAERVCYNASSSTVSCFNQVAHLSGDLSTAERLCSNRLDRSGTHNLGGRRPIIIRDNTAATADCFAQVGQISQDLSTAERVCDRATGTTDECFTGFTRITGNLSRAERFCGRTAYPNSRYSNYPDYGYGDRVTNSQEVNTQIIITEPPLSTQGDRRQACIDQQLYTPLGSRTNVSESGAVLACLGR
jgi:hypothetical protein